MNDQQVHILLVDDDKIDRQNVIRHIEKGKFPYNITIAVSFAEGRKRLEEASYDVILLDYQLNDGSGLELFPFTDGTPVIFVTGQGSEEIAVQAMRLGAYDYLIKDPARAYLSLLHMTIENVLKRKRAELAFMASEERFRALTENTTDLSVIIGKDGTFQYVSPSYRTLGYVPEQLMGKLPKKFVHPDDLPTFEQAFDQAQQHSGETLKMGAIRLQHKDGTYLYCEGLLTNLYDLPNVGGIVVNCRDITERKLAEDEIIKVMNEIQKATQEIKALRGILPLCSFCKKIRDDKGYWHQVDVYIHKHSGADISHGVCPDCLKIHYPDVKID